MLSSRLRQITFWLSLLGVMLQASLWSVVVAANDKSANPNKAGEELVVVYGFEFEGFVERAEQDLTLKHIINKAFEFRSEYNDKLSLADLHGIGDQLTLYVREKGYKFYTVYLPPQDIQHGVVRYQVNEGVLGDIRVNPKSANAPAILDVLSNFHEQPVYQPDIDDSVELLKSFSRGSLFAYYSRGSKPGEVRLNVNSRHDAYSYSLKADNYGGDSIGRERLMAMFNWHSPLNRFDRLTIGMQYANGDDDNLYGLIGYSLPLFDLKHTLGLSVSNNQFQLGEELAELELDGDARIYQASWRYQLERSATRSQSVSLVAEHKTSDYSSIFSDNNLQLDESEDQVFLEWRMQYLPRASGWSHGVQLAWHAGDSQIDGVDDERDHFDKLRMGYGLQWLSGVERWSSLIRWKTRGQHTSSKLPSFEQQLLTGAYATRSVRAGGLAVDRGGVSSIDWYFPYLIDASDNWRIEPYLFVDAAYGELLNREGEAFDRGSLWGAGLGLSLWWKNQWQLIVQSGKTQNETFSTIEDLTGADLIVELNFYGD